MNLSEFHKIYSFLNQKINVKNILNEVDDFTNLYLGRKSNINQDERNESEINSYLKKAGLNRNIDSSDNDIINENNISFNIINNTKFNDAFLRKKSGFSNMNYTYILSKDNQIKSRNNTIIVNDIDNINININNKR